MDLTRRTLLKGIAGFCTIAPFMPTVCGATTISQQAVLEGNFRFIYRNPAYKKEFFQFLTNVFHLYPELDFHQLIALVSNKHSSDKLIFKELQKKLSQISSVLAPLTYAIPALNQQKLVIGQQTQQLLGPREKFNGYLEIGSSGRYLDQLEELFDIEEQRVFISEKPSSYSPSDMVDRGQWWKAGDEISLNDYQPNMAGIARNSIDLVTVYIGFHHCPIHLRKEFLTNIRDVMRDGASLIVRDHDVVNPKMRAMVGLAHDVFNMGTNETWQYNEAELRNFYSLAQLDHMLVEMGFKSDQAKLYQAGDPTRNALMLYRKV